MDLGELRRSYHENVFSKIVFVDSNGIPNIADRSSTMSCAIARFLVHKISYASALSVPVSGQTAGSLFEHVNRDFLKQAFGLMHYLRPGRWVFDVTGDISQFQQYKHLADLALILHNNPELKTSLGTDYLITPDVVIARRPLLEAEINQDGLVVPNDKLTATLTPFRAVNQQGETLSLHASVSVKWTLRSDRAQNARTESLNLIRNRKGHTPHIVAVTAEPTPGRLASLALGTGDLDCVYHFALPELREAVHKVATDDTVQLLETLITGDRLRDISDLPLDLMI